MLEAPHITRVGARQTAVIRLNIPRSEIQSGKAPGLLAAVKAQGCRCSARTPL